MYDPLTGTWSISKSAEGFFTTQFGFAGTIPVVGISMGTARATSASTTPGGNWYLLKSAEGFSQTQFGFAGTIPVTGDFDGDGRFDIGVY